jgi:hypothetical protein
MFDVRELADIYGLPEETVKVELLESLSNSLAAVFGTEIEVLSSKAGNLEIYSYRDLSGDLQVRSLPVSSIGRHAIKRIRRDLSLSLAKIRVRRDYDFCVTRRILFRGMYEGGEPRICPYSSGERPCNPRTSSVHALTVPTPKNGGHIVRRCPAVPV